MKTIPGSTTIGPIIAPTITSGFVCPMVSFNLTNELSSNVFDMIFI